ncbi:MAG: glycosyltransferase family 2 protein [Nitrospirae bacterium]|nr:glycosyltransferase family 2 protein [Nitrospirota bacterium]
MVEPKVAIIIVHLDSRAALLACLTSCQAIHYRNYEILVVENGSRLALDPDALKDCVGRTPLVIRSPVNLGFSGGSNLGIRAALDRGADYVLLLNDDTEVAPDFLNVLVQAGEQDPAIGALGPTIYYRDDAKRIWFAGGHFDARLCQVQTPRSGELDAGAQPDVAESDWLTGCCLLMKRQACEKAGLLDERFFLYWEDADWSLRLRRVGLRTVTVPSAHIWHKISVSAGGAESALKWYHKTRSHLLFARLHAPHATCLLLRAMARDVAWLLVKSASLDRFSRARAAVSAVKDYYLGRSGRGPDWLWRQC